MEGERWTWVPGYEGRYQVSSLARVRSVSRWVHVRAYHPCRGRWRIFQVYVRGRMLKETSAYTVRLFKDGESWFISPRTLCFMVWGIRIARRPRGAAVHPRARRYRIGSVSSRELNSFLSSD